MELIYYTLYHWHFLHIETLYHHLIEIQWFALLLLVGCPSPDRLHSHEYFVLLDTLVIFIQIRVCDFHPYVFSTSY
jgi:hypothetical protein